MSAVTYGEMRGAGVQGRAAARSSDRAIAYAVLLSLLFHGALLFSFSMRPSGRRAAEPGPIIAHLVPPPAPAVVPPAPQPSPVRQAPPPPEPPRAQPKPKPKSAPSVRRVKPVPKPAPRTEAAAPAPRPTPSAPAAPAAPAAPSAPPQASVAPQAAPPAAIARTEPQPSSAGGADALQAYRSELIQVAKKYKRYPRVAMDNNWEGRAVVRLAVGANGLISSIVVTTSAGHEILDKQAQEMVRRAKTLVPIPAYLRGKDFAIEVPVIYNLKGEDAG